MWWRDRPLLVIRTVDELADFIGLVRRLDDKTLRDVTQRLQSATTDLKVAIAAQPTS